ncbi:MAG: Lysine--tRNA ligase [uncultured marine phage]|uniref:Lysine--tRNA ligase n=1 Tax=uncultured marine phage TaxID=707152 RepID=A0A8D9CCJ0_9VIRU|nr:MAG: Lysine--tRNA ligase [uncultured marine phage]
MQITEIGINLTLRGRILNRRRMGRASFYDILVDGDTVQVFSNNAVEGYEELLALPAGTFISVSGETFITRTGHNTLRMESYEVLHVPVRALPIVRDDGENRYNDIEDPESIRRRRYLRTIISEEERNTFITRSRLISMIRRVFEDLGYMEVETPILHPVYGGAEATPFVTHHEALDSEFYLRIAPELYLRRMIIGGYERVFEIGRNFRNEGISNRHNPEFTVIEAYAAFEDYTFSMGIVEDLISRISDEFGSEFEFGENTIDFTNVRRVRFRDIVEEVCNVDVSTMEDNEIAELFEREVETSLIDPTIVYDYPSIISPLALPREDDPSTAERFELFIGGMEIGNAYSELNDVELHLENIGDEDADFVEALEYGMPPTTGIGIGIDRLVMILTNRHIRDVIFFPSMRRQ